MGSQYLLANNNSPEIITVPFEHYSAIRIRIGNAKEISHSPFPSRHLPAQRKRRSCWVKEWLNRRN